MLNIIFFKEIEIGLYSAIAIYLMGLAEMTGHNLQEEVEKKMAINEKREYVRVNGILVSDISICVY